jgi:non-homologous end joining protein Ku
MAPRPHWKGFLKLSLVSCPIALYPAISPAERISFRQVNRQTGNRLRHQLADSVTGEVVESQNKGRGYEVGQDQFLIVREEELAQARQEARNRPYSASPAANIPGKTRSFRAVSTKAATHALADLRTTTPRL